MIHRTLVLCFVLLKGFTFGNINTKNLTYHVYQDLQLNGCRLVNLNKAKKSRLTCAILCSTNSSCAAFKFVNISLDCITCGRNDITVINFIRGEFTSLPRVMRQSNWPFARNQYTRKSVAVPGGMKAGIVARSMVQQLSPLPNRQGCVFCRKNNEEHKTYSTHLVKNRLGEVTCPILQKYRCPHCGATGKKAHTIKYCPNYDGSSAIGALLRTPRNGFGKRRLESVLAS